MELYLHIGTEKTGSSYLQTLMANNRKQLVAAGIHYPTSTWLEDQMLRGEISAGNGQELFESIRDGNREELRKLLKGFYKLTKDVGCNKTLISNELIIGAFKSKENWTIFQRVLKEAGFTELKMLLVLRNPNEQALSLYKHRAKGGSIPDIGQWLKNGYTLHQDLKNFMFVLENNHFACTIRKYRKDSDYMDRILFVDWLGISLPKIAVKKNVNPSLSLSELSLLGTVQQYRPELKNELYNRLLQLPKAEKAKETIKEKEYLNIIDNYLHTYTDVWMTCNRYLPIDEQIKMPLLTENKEYQNEVALVFSKAQADILAGLITESLQHRLRWKLRYRETRRYFGHLKQKIFKQ